MNQQTQPHHFDQHGRITRAGMEHAIRNGGSVSVGGKIVSRIEDLPDANAIARFEAARDAEANRLQREDLQRQLAAAVDPAAASALQAKLDNLDELRLGGVGDNLNAQIEGLKQQQRDSLAPAAASATATPQAAATVATQAPKGK
jgi:hypothetical protein